MGLKDALKYAIQDKIRERQIAAAEGGSGGKHRKPGKGKHERPTFCTTTWEDKGIPGSKHASYPHEDHICGSQPHNRGNHFCRDWNCSAQKPY